MHQLGGHIDGNDAFYHYTTDASDKIGEEDKRESRTGDGTDGMEEGDREGQGKKKSEEKEDEEQWGPESQAQSRDQTTAEPSLAHAEKMIFYRRSKVYYVIV